MYMPPQFNAKDRSHALALMRSHPFASLISTDDSGFPFVTHLPLHTEEAGKGAEGEGRITLLGHVAKPNPHWRFLQDKQGIKARALVTFMGPQAYMSPRVYPDLVRVPTWSYLAVHCTVQATLIDDPLAKDRLLKKLIGDHDPAYAPQWVSLDTDYQHKMLAGIMAFELEVVDLQCKLKLNQHRPESHAAMRAAYAQGNEQEKALAVWMGTLGLTG